MTTITTACGYAFSSSNDICLLRNPSNGYLYAVCITWVDGVVLAYRSTDDGATWSNLSAPTSKPPRDYDVSACLDGSGNLCIVYGGTGSPAGSLDEIYFMKWNGSTWTGPTLVVHDHGYAQMRCKIARDGTNLHVVWCARDASHTLLAIPKYRKSTDGGATWSATTNLPCPSSAGFFDAFLMVTAAGMVHAFFVGYSYGYSGVQGLYELVSTDHGASWPSYSLLLELWHPCHVNSPFVVEDSSGQLHMCFAGLLSSPGHSPGVCYMRQVSGSWGAPEAVIERHTGGCQLALYTGAAAANVPTIVFVDSSEVMSWTIKTVRRVGSGWSSPIQLAGPPPTYLGRPKISAQVSGWKFPVCWGGASLWTYSELLMEHAPGQPTMLTRSTFDATLDAAFTWQFNDEDPGDFQTAYQLVVTQVIGGATVYDSGKVASQLQTCTVPAATLSNGVQYNWKVKCWDVEDQAGLYSDLAQFWCSAPPEVWFTDPLADSVAATWDDAYVDGNADVGKQTNGEWRSQSFKCGPLTDAVDLWVRTVGTPTDCLRAYIYSDSAGLPSTLLGTSRAVPASEISAVYGWHRFDILQPVVYAAESTLHIVLKREGANDASNYYQWGSDASGGYADGVACHYSGAAWVSDSPVDMAFIAYQGGSHNSSSKAVDWGYRDPEANPQAYYRVRLTDETGADVLWDSLALAGAAGSQLIPIVLANNKTYRVYVTGWDDKGMISVETWRSMAVVFTPPPVPSLAVSPDSAHARIACAVTNPTPTPPEPNLLRNELYRRTVATTGDWVRIAVLAANETFYDYAVATDCEYEYYVLAVGENFGTARSVTAQYQCGVGAADAHVLAGCALAAQSFKVGVTANIETVSLWLEKVGTPTDNWHVEIRPGDEVLTSYSETNVDGDAEFGLIVYEEKRSQGFKVPAIAVVGRVSLWLAKHGRPTDNLIVEIQTDSGGLPSGTVVATSGVVAGSSLETDYGWIDFDFATPPALAPSTQYHLVVKRSGAMDVYNFYYWGIDATAPSYPNGTEALYSAGWHAEAYDAAFKVYNAGPGLSPVTNGTSGSILGAYLPTVTEPADFGFSPMPNLVAGQLYWLVLQRGGPVDPANYVQWAADDDFYADGYMAVAAADLAWAFYEDYDLLFAVGDQLAAPPGSSVSFRGVWLHSVDDPEATAWHFVYDGDERSTDESVDMTLLQFAGRDRPVVEYGTGGQRSLTANLALDATADKPALETLIRARCALCYRDGRQRKMFTSTPKVTLTDKAYGWQAQVAVSEIDYSEQVDV